MGDWVEGIGLSRSAYGTHSLRRTKVALTDKRTGHLRAVQILLGHTKLESTMRYFGVDAEDALTLSEATEIWDSARMARISLPRAALSSGDH